MAVGVGVLLPLSPAPPGVCVCVWARVRARVRARALNRSAVISGQQQLLIFQSSQQTFYSTYGIIRYNTGGGS